MGPIFPTAGVLTIENPTGRDPARPFVPGWRARPGRVRPMVPVAVAMAAGIVVDRLVEPCGTAAWATIALAGAVLSLAAGRRAWAAYPALIVAVAAIGGAWHHARWTDRAADDLSRFVSTEPRPAWVRGFLLTVPEHRVGLAEERPGDEGYTRFELQITAASDGRAWHPASGRAIVSAGGDRTDLAMGDPIEAAGALALIAGPMNPGERDPRDYPRSRGIRLRLSVDDPAGLSPDPTGRPRPMLRCLGRIRTWGDRQLVDRLGERTAPLASALLLGRRGGIDWEVADAFSRTGTAHILAISGLHLSAVAGALGLVACLAGLGPKGAARLVLVAAVGYATLVGWSPSVSRAAAMVSALCLAAILDRSAAKANTLALAAVLTLVINPSFLFGVGWSLSFLGVAVLTFGARPMLRWLERRAGRDDPDGDPLDALERRLEPRWKRAARRAAIGSVAALAASAAVTLATMPLVAWRFNVVAPIGILLNLPMVLLAGLAVISGGGALVLSAIWGPLAAPAAWVCDRVLGIALLLVDRAEAVPGGHAFVPSPPTGWVIGAYLMFALASRASAARWRASAVRSAWIGLGVVLVIGSVATLAPRRPSSFEVEILAVGHGLATVIQGPDGSAALYDCGRSGDPGVGRRIAAPALWSRGVRRLEAVVISHADSDHYNGLPDLLDRFDVGGLVVPEGFDAPNNPGAEALLDAARARGIPVREATAGETIGLVPGLDAVVLHPAAGWLPDAADNDRSLVLDLEVGGRHLLLTGDLDGSGLAELVARPGFPIDAMVAPHHGGRSANPPWLYDWAAPSVVVSSQRAPRPGTEDTLGWLERRGGVVRRTWHDGAVLLRCGGAGPTGPALLAGWAVGDRPAGGSPIAPAFGGRVVSASIGVLPSPAAVRWLVAIGGLALGAWACLAITVIHWGAWTLVLPGRPPTGPPDTLPGPWRSVEIDSADGLRLRGWWLDAGPTGPAASGRIALILHGMAEASPSMRARGETLGRAGWSVLLPDLRAFGRSGGDRCSFGAREAADVRAWVDALAVDHPGATFALWGRSMGAAVALRAAAAADADSEDDRIAALILEAPYADLRLVLASRLARLPIPCAALLADAVLDRASRLAGDRLDRPRPIDQAPRVTAPVLILQGELDRVSPASEARRLASALPDAHPPEVEIVPGAGHVDVFDLGGPALADRIIAFLDRSASSA